MGETARDGITNGETGQGGEAFRLSEDGLAFLPLPDGPCPRPTGRPWSGRRRPANATLDLRLDGPLAPGERA